MAFLVFTSCNDDDDPSPKERTAERLTSKDWDVESWTEDGAELIPSPVSSFEMEYSDWDGDEGDFEWTYNLSGDVFIERGEFEINEAGDELELKFQQGGGNFSGSFEMNIEFDGDELMLDGTLGGFRYEIVAD